MANQYMTDGDFREILIKSNIVSDAFIRLNSFLTYKGRRVIKQEIGGYILFEACEWCGSRAQTFDDYGGCSKCGGYPTANLCFMEKK